MAVGKALEGYGGGLIRLAPGGFADIEDLLVGDFFWIKDSHSGIYCGE